jgi:hypothetical protein
LRVGFVVFVGGLCGALSACGSDDASESAATSLRVDETRGTVGGVSIGSSKATVARFFGSYGRAPQAYPSEPLDADDAEDAGGPWSVITGPHHLGPGGLRGEQVTLRYEGVAFFVRNDRAFGFLVSAKGARTSKGVAIGDRLRDVRDAYPDVTCEDASRGDTTATQAASCSGKTASGGLLYFGGDPVRSITVMEHSRSHYDY